MRRAAVVIVFVIRVIEEGRHRVDVVVAGGGVGGVDSPATAGGGHRQQHLQFGSAAGRSVEIELCAPRVSYASLLEARARAAMRWWAPVERAASGSAGEAATLERAWRRAARDRARYGRGAP